MHCKKITKRCPCGYVFKKEILSNKVVVPPSGIITCVPGEGPVVHDGPTVRYDKVKEFILQGDTDFVGFSVVTGVNYMSRYEWRKGLMSCPKCGTVLDPAFAMSTSEEELEYLSEGDLK